ncbi:MAG TPA: TlpA disulfide reductase family protein [Candidatus Limnocylindrales bacterium]|nr:TlpA disulfide reductase family protein [Candidatus Limnocylindrales bacterium]
MRGSVLLGLVLGLLAVGVAAAVLLASIPERPLGLPSTAPATLGGSPTGDPGGTASPGPTGSPSVGLRVGDQAPPLKVAQLGGGEIDLARLRGKPVWVNFTGTYCPPCRDEMGFLRRFDAELNERLTIVAVFVKDDQDAVASLAAELGLTFPIGLDPNGVAEREWSAYGLPVHYWLDGEGIVRGFAFGGPDPQAFLDGVRSVLPDVQIEL